MAPALKTCISCEKQFLVKFRFQIERRGSEMVYYCSQACRQEQTEQQGQVHCSSCDKAFVPTYAFQQATVDGRQVHYCSMACRTPAVQDYRQRRTHTERGPMRIAVLNQKGGTGKTTTTVALGSGLALAGHRVLIIDVDSQGHVAISLGIEGKHTLYHLMVEERPLNQCVINARPNLDVLVGDDTLASAEIFLARKNEGRDKLLRKVLHENHDYDFILLDCGPSLSLLNMNALTFADHLIVPVSCDFLSLVGVKQVMKTLKNVNQVLLHPISIMGILPTFYDMRNNISDESIKTLKGYFHDKVLPPIRVNTRLKEAPQHRQSIFEYAPDSRGASDYQKVVDWVVREHQRRAQATA
ncbi:AAA family ATPase [Lujinxingia vulgaris]|nr:AAA family ATPase [Lujinxingia vulgaris]